MSFPLHPVGPDRPLSSHSSAAPPVGSGGHSSLPARCDWHPSPSPCTARECLFSLPCATAPSPLLANRARLSSAVHGGQPLSLPGAANTLSLRDRRTLPALKCAAFPFPRWSAHSRPTSPPGDNPRFCNHPIQRRTGKRRPTKGRQKGRAERSAANPNVHWCAVDNWIASAPRPANGPPPPRPPQRRAPKKGNRQLQRALPLLQAWRSPRQSSPARG